MGGEGVVITLAVVFDRSRRCYHRHRGDTPAGNPFGCLATNHSSVDTCCRGNHVAEPPAEAHHFPCSNSEACSDQDSSLVEADATVGICFSSQVFDLFPVPDLCDPDDSHADDHFDWRKRRNDQGTF